MKSRVLIAAALAAMICAAPVWSQGGPPPGGPGGMKMTCPAMAIAPPSATMISSLTDQLGLSEDQVTTLKSATTKCDDAMKTLQQKAGDATKALRDALVASTYDAENVKSLAAVAEKAEAAIITARIDEWTQIRSVLTASQVKKLQETMSAQRPGQRPAGGPPAGPDGAPPPPPPGQDQ